MSFGEFTVKSYYSLWMRMTWSHMRVVAYQKLHPSLSPCLKSTCSAVNSLNSLSFQNVNSNLWDLWTVISWSWYNIILSCQTNPALFSTTSTVSTSMNITATYTLYTWSDAVSWVSSSVMISGWWRSSVSRVSPKPCLNPSNSWLSRTPKICASLLQTGVKRGAKACAASVNVKICSSLLPKLCFPQKNSKNLCLGCYTHCASGSKAWIREKRPLWVVNLPQLKFSNLSKQTMKLKMFFGSSAAFVVFLLKYLDF